MLTKEKLFLVNRHTYRGEENLLFDRLVARLRGQMQSQDAKSAIKLGEQFTKPNYRRKYDDSGEYPFIPLSSEAAQRSIYVAKEIIEYKFGCLSLDWNFYDLGSGYGNILFIAANSGIPGHRVHGVEKHYYEDHLYLIEPSIVKDMNDLEEGEIEERSIVYLYNPFTDNSKMQKALNHIISIVLAPTLIIFHSANGNTIPTTQFTNKGASRDAILFNERMSTEYLLITK